MSTLLIPGNGGELRYNGKELNPWPSNVSASAAYDELVREGKTFVVLQPGDATRYEVIIVTGIVTTGAPDYFWWVFPVNIMTEAGQKYVDPSWEIGPWDLSSVSNEWSRTFLAAWLNWFRTRQWEVQDG